MRKVAPYALLESFCSSWCCVSFWIVIFRTLSVRRWRICRKRNLKVILIKQSKIKVSETNIDVKTEVQYATWGRLSRENRFEWRHISKVVWQERVMTRRMAKGLDRVIEEGHG